jgi:xanthine dehydrogenase accessory factor
MIFSFASSIVPDGVGGQDGEMPMIDILETLERCINEKRKVALATVVRTWGSSPRSVGAKMVVSEDGEFAGSVSGGCVEGAIIEEAGEVIKKRKAKLLHYGVADEVAWNVGLACGGEIDVLLEPLLDEEGQQFFLSALNATLKEGSTFVIAHVIGGGEDLIGQHMTLTEDGESIGDLHEDLIPQVRSASSRWITEGRNRIVDFSFGDETIKVFFECIRAPSKLIIVGGVHIAIPLVRIARIMGYRVFLVDPRTAFCNETRFPNVDSLINKWPDQGLIEVGLDSSTAVAVLSHDPKLDDPALRVALPSNAFYVGALGSRGTQRKRRQRLRDYGLNEGQINRLRGPIGLDLGGRAPEEIALSIMAEIIAVRSHSTLVLESTG